MEVEKKKITKREAIQKEATETIIKNKFNGILYVSPRVGKTKIIIDSLNQIKSAINVLVLAPRLEILKSWENEIKKWNLKESISIDYLWSNSIAKKAKKGVYHLIIADECHAYNLKVLAKLRELQINGSRILGATGTLDEEAEFNLNNILSLRPFYSYSFAQAIKDKIIADYKITCIGVPLNDTRKNIESGNAEKSFMQTELAAYTYWDNKYKMQVSLGRYKNLRYLSSKRLDIIYNSETKLRATKKLLATLDKALIFTGRQNIADQLGEDSFHSKSSSNSLELFKEGKVNQLGVVSMISMGITIPNLKTIVFNQIKSGESLAIQQSMRAMNLEGDNIAEIYVIYLKNTQDEVWVKSALKGFEKSKIDWK